MMRSMLSRIALPLFLLTCSTAQAEEAAVLVREALVLSNRSALMRLCNLQVEDVLIVDDEQLFCALRVQS